MSVQALGQVKDGILRIKEDINPSGTELSCLVLQYPKLGIDKISSFILKKIRYSPTKSHRDYYNFIKFTLEKEVGVIKSILAGDLIDIEFKENGEGSLLYFAIVFHQSEIVRLLLDKGARLDNLSIKSIPYLHLATQRQNLATMKIILKFGGDINVVDSNGSTALHLVCQQGFIAGLKLLLRFGVKIDVRDNEGKVPFFKLDNEEQQNQILQVLFDYGITPNTVIQRNKKTLFHLTCQQGNAKAVEFLLQRSAKVEIRSETGETALHYAALNRGSTGPLKFLLERNLIDVNEKTFRGNTPINPRVRAFELIDVFIKSYSACKNFYELLMNGANVGIPDKEGKRLKVVCQNHEKCPVLLYFKKLEVLNFKIDDFTRSTFPPYHDNEFYQFQILRFKKELEDLKNIKIRRCNMSPISLSEFLFMKRRDILIYMNNLTLLRYRDGNFKKKFPHLGDILNMRFSQGLKRKTLQDEACHEFGKLVGTFEYSCCFENIIMYLNNVQVRKIKLVNNRSH